MQVTVGSGSAIHRQSRRLQPMEKESDRAVMTNIPLVGHIITDDDIGFTEVMYL